MRTLQVLIEKNGVPVPVGVITGSTEAPAAFRYTADYLESPGAAPISVSLPLQEGAFSVQRTRAFFDGLLPEGFTRRSVAQRLHLDEEDYLSMLSALGGECLGAIRILEGEDQTEPARYERLSAEQVKALAAEGTSRTAELIAGSHLSLTGASGKAGLYYSEGEKVWYQPFGDAPSTHIVKQSHIRLEEIVVNEQLCLMTAGALGIPVPQSFIINTGCAADEDVLFATRRYDRRTDPAGQAVSGLPRPLRLHQEDFAQALGIAAAEKYEREDGHYLQRCFALLRAVSADPLRDQLQLWDQLLFDYLIGNTDNHIKNISLLYSPDLRSVRLAPAYDILSTAVYRSGTRNMAIGLGGAYSLDDIDRGAVAAAAKEAGLGAKLALSRLDAMAKKLPPALLQAAERLHGIGFSNAGGIADRILRFGGIAAFTAS